MIDRRSFIAGGAGLAAATLGPQMSYARAALPYEQAVASTWVPLRPGGGLEELVRYATLAANSHNTAPELPRSLRRPAAQVIG
jgi:hypothetical protein